MCNYRYLTTYTFQSFRTGLVGLIGKGEGLDDEGRLFLVGYRRAVLENFLVLRVFRSGRDLFENNSTGMLGHNI